MYIKQLSRMLWLSGLLLLTACTTSTSPQAGQTPIATVSISPPVARAQPSPTPSLFGGASASLGPLPQTCPLSSIRAPKTLTEFGPMVGAGSAWAGAIRSYKQVPLALVWSPNDALEEHNQYGWGHKLLWVVATHVQGAVTIHGMNLQTGIPLYPDAEYAEASSTPTALILNPSDPTVVSQDANRDDQWTQFPGGLTVPGAGCYELSAIWPGGGWHLTFAAGVVPSSS